MFLHTYLRREGGGRPDGLVGGVEAEPKPGIFYFVFCGVKYMIYIDRDVNVMFTRYTYVPSPGGWRTTRWSCRGVEPGIRFIFLLRGEIYDIYTSWYIRDNYTFIHIYLRRECGGRPDGFVGRFFEPEPQPEIQFIFVLLSTIYVWYR